MQTAKPSPAEIHQALFAKVGKRTVGEETQIQNACIQWLNYLHGVRVWRQNTGGRDWIDRKGRKRFQAFGIPGQSDITGFGPAGRRIEIEIKKPGKEPELLQEQWLETMLQGGCIAFWCDSLETCQQQARTFGLEAAT